MNRKSYWTDLIFLVDEKLCFYRWQIPNKVLQRFDNEVVITRNEEENTLVFLLLRFPYWLYFGFIASCVPWNLIVNPKLNFYIAIFFWYVTPLLFLSCQYHIWFWRIFSIFAFKPIDTRHKLNLYKTFRRHPRRLMHF